MKKGQLDELSQMQSNAGALAEMAFKKILYGQNHVLGYLGKGTSETVKSLTLDDVKNYYNNLMYHLI